MNTFLFRGTTSTLRLFIFKEVLFDTSSSGEFFSPPTMKISVIPACPESFFVQEMEEFLTRSARRNDRAKVSSGIDTNIFIVVPVNSHSLSTLHIFSSLHEEAVYLHRLLST